ncbi:MAG: TRAP transporter substrate-binding protein [Rhodospirillales bacterium]|nr:TRAP transporter substrate-binding protein [Rhodospirillales bacterium]
MEKVLTPARRAVSRRGALVLGTAALAAPAIARAQTKFTYKFANNVPMTHPLNIRAKAMADAVAKDTNGAFQVKIFPNNQLGGDTDMLSQLRVGGIQFFTLSGLILSTLVPAASINGIGFAFPDYATVWKAMDGPLGAYIRGQIAKSGLVAMDKIWDNGFRQTTSATKPIKTPQDLAGFKIRVPPSPLWTSMFKALGAAPTSINFAEVYSALQTHLVDGQENPLAIISVAKLYEVQKYCALTNHMWDGFWFLANGRAWKKLPKEMQAVFTRHANEAAQLERGDVEKLNAGLQSDLAAKGMVFNTVEAAPFRNKLRSAGFYAEWHKKYGDAAWRLLESSVGNLG